MNFGHKKLYIGGRLQAAESGKQYELVFPGDESTIGTIAWAGKADTAKALKAAQEGFAYWSALPLEERLDWIAKLRQKLIDNEELLRNSIMYEMGKVWSGTEEDFTSITNSLAYYPEEMRKISDIPLADREGTHQHYLKHQPVGVVVAFLAYNFPLLNLGFKLGPALAAGCSIIIKPSEYSSLSAYTIGELCAEIDFPAGVINVLCGDVPEVGVPLCESTIPRLITMIGATETAQKLITQSTRTSIKRFSMECGGNAPFIVMDDADMSEAVAIGAGLKIGNSGQICVAPNRYYVHAAIVEEFTQGLLDKFRDVPFGFGHDEKPTLGPLANQVSVDKVHAIVQEALAQGGELLTGGQLVERPGYYYPLTVIRLDDIDAPVFQREIFGPVVLLTSFSEQEEVLVAANSTEAGLASYVFSAKEETLNYFADGLEFGEVQLNGVKYDIYLPHGGIKNSGIGVDCSPYALDDYLIKKRVTKAL